VPGEQKAGQRLAGGRVRYGWRVHGLIIVAGRPSALRPRPRCWCRYCNCVRLRLPFMLWSPSPWRRRWRS